SARAAYASGCRFDDMDLQALGLVYQGYALVRLGRAREGRPLLDEAMACATAGGLKPMARGLVYCRTLSACLNCFDYRRAFEWMLAIDQCQNAPNASAFPGDCRTHRAMVLIVHGAWAEGEQEARSACE